MSCINEYIRSLVISVEIFDKWFFNIFNRYIWEYLHLTPANNFILLLQRNYKCKSEKKWQYDFAC